MPYPRPWNPLVALALLVALGCAPLASKNGDVPEVVAEATSPDLSAPDDGQGPADMPDGEAASPDTAGCVCLAAGPCCDGCKPKNTRGRCDAEASAWGVCGGGACRPVGDVREWVGHADSAWLQALAFSPDGAWLATAASDRTGAAPVGEALVWSVATGAILQRLEGATDGVAFSPDGAWLAQGLTDRVRVLATAGWGVVHETTGAFGPVAFSPDGGLLAAGSTEGVALLETAGWTVARQLDHADDPGARLWQVAFSADGSRLASATGQHGLGSPHGDVRVWEPSTGQRLHTFDCPALSLAFAPDGGRLATACWNMVDVWSLDTGEVAAEILVADAAIGVAWSPDGARLAVGSLFGGASLVDAGAPAYPVDAPFLPVPGAKALVFDGEGRLTVGAWEDPVVVTWTPLR
jgi:WD40 repeat protein